MKQKKLLIALLSVAAFVAGCNKEKAVPQQFEKAEAETKEAAQDMKDYTYAQKTEFVQEMQSQLTTLNRDLDMLSDKIEKSNDKVKAEAKPKLRALREQSTQLQKHLDEAKNANEGAWNDVKAGTKKAYGALKVGFQDARQWVSDKIAP